MDARKEDEVGAGGVAFAANALIGCLMTELFVSNVLTYEQAVSVIARAREAAELFPTSPAARGAVRLLASEQAVWESKAARSN